MRKQYLAASESLSPAERNHILQLTSLFERASWSLNRFATLLREAPGLGVAADGDAIALASQGFAPSLGQ